MLPVAAKSKYQCSRSDRAATPPGIGPSLAKRLLITVTTAGRFARSKTLRMSGIGAKRFEQLKDYISVH